LRFNHSSDNGKDPPQLSTSLQSNLPSSERREETSTHSQNGGLTDRKSVYRPPWLPKAEEAPLSVFDLLIDPLVELNTSDHATQANGDIDSKHGGEQAMEEDTRSYDLRPPTLPKRYSLGIENTVDMLYGEQHLQNILKDKKLRREFATFLAQRLPSQMANMIRLSENEKAIAAITYANAIAQAQRPMTGSQQPAVAAIVSEQFVQDGQRTFRMLLAEGLPAYIAHVLTNEVMKYMEKQIPRMRLSHMDQQPVKGISEVFCLTDPNMKDHPIIYASKEFFRLTQYGRDYAIGRNCRFLQGPKTGSDSVFRLGRAIRDGREVCETILNYRRDGTPFLNLLLMAPLRDGQGNVKASLRSMGHYRVLKKSADSPITVLPWCTD
jgi:PAS domain-containing protein